MLKYKVGDRVRIVSKWADPEGPQNRDGKMNCWLGKIMTVAYVNGYNCRMMEDNGLWCWNDSLIAGLAEAPESIHITRDGNTVHAVHKRGDKVVGRASAKCSPDDTFDFAVGAKLAVERVFAVREVSRQAKVGEYIKLVTSGGFTFSRTGDIALVSKTVGTSVCADSKAFERGPGYYPNTWHFYQREYVVLEGYTPPESSTPKPDGKYVPRLGDRVHVKTSGGFFGALDEDGTVICKQTCYNQYGVHFDHTAKKMHNCTGFDLEWGKIGTDFKCAWVRSEQLTLISHAKDVKSEEPKTPQTRGEIMRKYLAMSLDELTERICDGRSCPQCPIFQKNVGSDADFCSRWEAEHSDAAKYLIAAKLTEEELEAQKKC